jgi:hypothetical protein
MSVRFWSRLASLSTFPVSLHTRPIFCSGDATFRLHRFIAFIFPNLINEMPKFSVRLVNCPDPIAFTHQFE